MPTALAAPSQFRVNYPAIMKKIFALLALAGIANVAAAADVVGNANAAENKVAMCIGCHGIPGYKTAFPEVYQVPMIGGQSAKYIENALKAYQKGDRTHPSMRGIAASLSDQDIADVAAYYSQQK
ncbi:MAG: cytochrome c [Herminiimonas sp.]|nr:cytochrome c [Herminiimonas sp.]